MIKTSGIYVICHIKSGNIYIGQATNFHTRWNEHKRLLRGGIHTNKHLQHAWEKYGESAFKFQKLEYCSVEELNQREQHYLDIYMPKGICYNHAAFATAPMRGRKHSPESIRKIGEASRNISEETRQKLRDGQKNRPPISEETREKLKVAQKNKPPVSEESRKRMSESRKGRVISEEWRQKLSEATKGIPRSEEARRNMSEGAKKRWAKERAKRENEINGLVE